MLVIRKELKSGMSNFFSSLKDGWECLVQNGLLKFYLMGFQEEDDLPTTSWGVIWNLIISPFMYF
jgi:hypothetical protein